MDTEPFDEADLLVLPTSPAASPPRRLKRLKKSSQTTTTTTPPAVSSPTPSPSPPPQQPSPDEETLAPYTSPPPYHSPPPPSDADALTSLPSSPPNPSSSPLPPTDTAEKEEEEEEEEDDGLDPLFSETGCALGWDPLGAPTEGVDGEDEEEMLGGGLIEELRREKSAKRRLDMDESEGGGEMEVEVQVKGKRSKRRKEEDALKESARGKKQSEKERRVQLNSIHAESQRLLRETRSASFKPIAQPVYKPISSVLEKIRLRKLEILKKSNTPFEEEDDDASSEPVSDPAGNSGMPRAKEVDTDDKDLKIDDADNGVGANGSDLNEHDSVPGDEDDADNDVGANGSDLNEHDSVPGDEDDADNDVGANGSDLNEHDSVPGDEDALTREKDLNNCGSNVPDKEVFDDSRDNHEDNARSSDNPINAVDETQLAPSSSPTNSSDDTSSEDEEANDKENVDPSSQKNDVNIHQRLERAVAGDSCPDDAILKDFLDVEAEEEDDSDDDMMRFKDNEEDDGSDGNEVFNDLIAAGFEEEEVDHEKRNALHQKWLQQQDAAETNNVMQRLKFGHQEQKELMDQDEDDTEDCEDESENEMSFDLTPTNVVRQNSEKAKQMIAKMFTDENDTYEHSDNEEIEEHLARQRISKREVHSNSFISPLEDDNSREVFSLIKKLNIAPQSKRRGKQTTSNLDMLIVGKNSSGSSKSSFLGRTASGPVAASHRSVYRTYVFGRDDSNSSSRSCLSTSESNSDMDRTNSSQPKKAKFSSSQPKPVATRAGSEGDASSGVSLFEILRRSSVTSEKQEYSRQESCGIITESQAAHQFSAFKLSRRFSRVGARN